jgi:hypothetical protein
MSSATGGKTGSIGAGLGTLTPSNAADRFPAAVWLDGRVAERELWLPAARWFFALTAALPGTLAVTPVVALLSQHQASQRPHVAAAVVIAVVFAAASAAILVLAIRLRLMITPDHVEIHNLLHTNVFHVDAVERFEVTGGNVLQERDAPRAVARLHNGQVVDIRALRREGWDWRLPSYAAQIAAQVDKANATLLQCRRRRG